MCLSLSFISKLVGLGFIKKKKLVGLGVGIAYFSTFKKIYIYLFYSIANNQ
jgi:hypothetical protein